MTFSAALIACRIFLLTVRFSLPVPFNFTQKTWKTSKVLSGPNSVTRDRVAQLSLYRTLRGKITVEKVLWPREMRRYGRLRDKVNEVRRFCNATVALVARLFPRASRNIFIQNEFVRSRWECTVCQRARKSWTSITCKRENGESVHRMYTIGVHARENRSFIITGSTADRPSTDIQGYAPWINVRRATLVISVFPFRQRSLIVRSFQRVFLNAAEFLDAVYVVEVGEFLQKLK